jgi:fatty-acyl-CoA synthase
MEMPLTPLDFARRARRLYADREAVVDGDLRLTYVQFLERCNRWTSTLQALGVRQGDRVAYIAPNTHAHLEAYYSVPQTGAVLVPINYRLLPDDFEYITNHFAQRSFALTLTISKPSMASGTVCLASNTSWRWKVRETAGSITNRL